MSKRHALFAATIALLALPALPAAAQTTLHDTHAEMWMPAGKVPQRTYRPLTRNDCAPVSRTHLAGKTMLQPDVAPNGRRCVTETASRAEVKPNTD